MIRSHKHAQLRIKSWCSNLPWKPSNFYPWSPTCPNTPNAPRITANAKENLPNPDRRRRRKWRRSGTSRPRTPVPPAAFSVRRCLLRGRRCSSPWRRRSPPPPGRRPRRGEAGARALPRPRGPGPWRLGRQATREPGLGFLRCVRREGDGGDWCGQWPDREVEELSSQWHCAHLRRREKRGGGGQCWVLREDWKGWHRWVKKWPRDFATRWWLGE